MIVTCTSTPLAADAPGRWWGCPCVVCRAAVGGFVAGCGSWRVSLRVMTCGVGMRWWAGAGTTWPKAFCLGRVCAGGRPGKRGRSAARQRRAWRTWGACCLRGRRALPRIDEPDLLVTGARPDAGGRLGAGGGGLAPGSGPARTAAVGPDPEHGWSGPGT